MYGESNRRAKTELEAAGESTEGMAVSTSKLRDQIKGLTNIDGKGGFDILAQSGEFKSTYEIFDGIADVWANMDKNSTNAAALLELLAGKNRANQVAALLSNWKQVEKAYEAAQNAEGSSRVEQDRFLNSVEAKTKKLSSNFERLSIGLLDPDTLKVALDFVNGLVEGFATIAENAGSLPTLVGTATAALAIFKPNSGIFGTKTNLDGSTSFTTPFSRSREAKVAFTKQLADEMEAMSAYLKLKEKFDDYDSSDFRLSKQDLFRRMSVEARAIAEADDFNAASIVAYGKSMEGTAKKVGLLSKSLGVLKSAGAAIGNTLISMAASFLIEKIIEGVNNWIHAEEIAIDKTNELVAAWDESNRTLVEQKKLINDADTGLGERYEELSKGVNTATNENISLGTDEYAEYLDIVNQLAGAMPSLVTGYDAQGNAILNAAGSLSELNAEFERLAQLSRDQIIRDAAEATKGAFAGLTGEKEGALKALEDMAALKAAVQGDNISEEYRNNRAMRASEVANAIYQTREVLDGAGNLVRKEAIQGAYKPRFKEYLEAMGFSENDIDGSIEDYIAQNADSVLRAIYAYEQILEMEAEAMAQTYSEIAKAMFGNELVEGGRLANADQTIKTIANLLPSLMDGEFYKDFGEGAQAQIAIQEWVNGVAEAFTTQGGSDAINAMSSFYEQYEANAISWKEMSDGIIAQQIALEKAGLGAKMAYQIALHFLPDGMQTKFSVADARLSDVDAEGVKNLKKEVINFVQTLNSDQTYTLSEVQALMAEQAVRDASSLEELTKSYTDFTEARTQALSNLSTLSEQGYLTPEQWQQLQSSGYDDAIRETQYGTKYVDYQAMREADLVKVQEKVVENFEAKAVKQKELNKLTEEYTKALAENSDEAKQKAEDIEKLKNEINLIDLMNESLWDSTSALNAFKQASSMAELGDNFRSAKEALDAINEGLETGRVGTNKFKAALELLGGKSMLDAFERGDFSRKQLQQYTKQLGKYYDKDGNIDRGKAFDTFVKEGIGSYFKGANGERRFAFNPGVTMQKIQEALGGIPEEMATYFLDAINEYAAGMNEILGPDGYESYQERTRKAKEEAERKAAELELKHDTQLQTQNDAFTANTGAVESNTGALDANTAAVSGLADAIIAKLGEDDEDKGGEDGPPSEEKPTYSKSEEDKIIAETEAKRNEILSNKNKAEAISSFEKLKGDYTSSKLDQPEDLAETLTGIKESAEGLIPTFKELGMEDPLSQLQGFIEKLEKDIEVEEEYQKNKKALEEKNAPKDTAGREGKVIPKNPLNDAADIQAQIDANLAEYKGLANAFAGSGASMSEAELTALSTNLGNVISTLEGLGYAGEQLKDAKTLMDNIAKEIEKKAMQSLIDSYKDPENLPKKDVAGRTGEIPPYYNSPKDIEKEQEAEEARAKEEARIKAEKAQKEKALKDQINSEIESLNVNGQEMGIKELTAFKEKLAGLFANLFELTGDKGDSKLGETLNQKIDELIQERIEDYEQSSNLPEKDTAGRTGKTPEKKPEPVEPPKPEASEATPEVVTESQYDPNDIQAQIDANLAELAGLSNALESGKETMSEGEILSLKDKAKNVETALKGLGYAGDALKDAEYLVEDADYYASIAANRDREKEQELITQNDLLGIEEELFSGFGDSASVAELQESAANVQSILDALSGLEGVGVDDINADEVAAKAKALLGLINKAIDDQLPDADEVVNTQESFDKRVADLKNSYDQLGIVDLGSATKLKDEIQAVYDAWSQFDSTDIGMDSSKFEGWIETLNSIITSLMGSGMTPNFGFGNTPPQWQQGNQRFDPGRMMAHGPSASDVNYMPYNEQTSGMMKGEGIFEDPKNLEVTMSIKAEDSGAQDQIDEIKEQASEGADMPINVDGESAKTALDELSASAQTGETKPVSADTTSATSSVSALDGAIATPVTKPVDSSSIQAAIVLANTLNSTLSTPVSKNVGLTQGEGAAAADGGVMTAHGLARVDGGSAYSSGKNALVGEIAPEIIVDRKTGTWRLVSHPQLTKLNPGDIVFNGEQTKDILNGRETRFSKALVDGNVKGKSFASGSNKTTKTGYLYALPTSTKSGQGLAGPGLRVIGVQGNSQVVDNPKPNGSGGSGGGSGGGGGGSSDDENDWKDWIERVLEIAKEATEDAIDEIANKIGYIAQNKQIDVALDKNAKEIAKNESAYNRYMAQAATVASENGLSDDIVNKIKNGTIDITEYDSETLEAISDYEEWYEKALDCKDVIEELQDQELELQRMKLDNIDEYYDHKIDRIEAKLSKHEAKLDRKNAYGQEIKKSDYTAAIKDSRDKITQLQKERAAYEKQFNELVKAGVLKPDSNEWHEYISALEEMDEDIIIAQTDLQNLINEMENIDLTNLENALKRINALRDDLEGFLGFHESQGVDNDPQTYIDLIENGFAEIENLRQQNALLREQQEGLDVGSERWQELQEQIESNEQAIWDVMASQEEWNDTIADMQIEMLEREREELEKTNEELEKRKEMEDALEDLEKAKSQRTKLIYREGKHRCPFTQ